MYDPGPKKLSRETGGDRKIWVWWFFYLGPPLGRGPRVWKKGGSHLGRGGPLSIIAGRGKLLTLWVFPPLDACMMFSLRVNFEMSWECHRQKASGQIKGSQNGLWGKGGENPDPKRGRDRGKNFLFFKVFWATPKKKGYLGKREKGKKRPTPNSSPFLNLKLRFFKKGGLPPKKL